MELFDEVGALRVRDLFKKVKLKVLCIVFMDDIDVMVRQRGVRLGGGNVERKQIVN